MGDSGAKKFRGKGRRIRAAVQNGARLSTPAAKTSDGPANNPAGAASFRTDAKLLGAAKASVAMHSLIADRVLTD
jgi:hypothetical protein